MALAKIQTYHCSRYFRVSIQVATTEREAMRPSHKGTGESVARSRANHRTTHSIAAVTMHHTAVNLSMRRTSVTGATSMFSGGREEEGSPGSAIPEALRAS